MIINRQVTSVKLPFRGLTSNPAFLCRFPNMRTMYASVDVDMTMPGPTRDHWDEPLTSRLPTVQSALIVALVVLAAFAACLRQH